MAKLNKEKQKQTAASASGFEPIPNGAYHVKLAEVRTDGEGPSGPYWTWEFDIVEEGHQGRKLWNNTSLSSKAAFKMKETYDAFGVGYDTDTDDLIGQCVKAIVSTRTIEAGARKGELANQIERLTPPDEDFTAPEDSKDEDIF